MSPLLQVGVAFSSAIRYISTTNFFRVDLMFKQTIPLILLAASTVPCAGGEGLHIGDRAPDFELPLATRDSISETPLSLSRTVGKTTIVLAFYPADWSGGCTREMCTFRDSFSGLGEFGAQVYGISGDYVYSHFEWAKHLNLPFGLLSDHTHEVSRKYDSFNNDTGYNKRTVYVINKTGKIAYIDPAYKAGNLESFDRLKEALKSLK